MSGRHNKLIVPLAKELRKNMTDEEKHLWYDFLRTYPVRFIRQKIIDGYIVDFYCAKAKIVIELDGSQHGEEKNAKADATRDIELSKYDIQVLRIPNFQIWSNFQEVCRHIDCVIQQSLSQQADSSLCTKEP
ncbi:MAG: endonuclease domain-containing protein [Clostridia bacterium]|nr:endonuclease domain-containing protein [Clostridia bacterium]